MQGLSKKICARACGPLAGCGTVSGVMGDMEDQLARLRQLAQVLRGPWGGGEGALRGPWGGGEGAFRGPWGGGGGPWGGGEGALRGPWSGGEARLLGVRKIRR